MLIWIQRPDAEFVTSFKTIRDMGYQLNKGSLGIKVFIPNFITLVTIKVDEQNYEIKPLYLLNDIEKKKYKDKNDDDITYYKQKLTGFSLGNVFDVRDTNIPMDVIDNELKPIIYDDKAEDIMDCFIKTIYNDGFKVEFRDMKGLIKGHCDFENNLIVVKKGLGSLMQMKVLIHEYAHSLAHKHLKNNNKDYQAHRNQYESEAESIAYVVSKYLGLQTTEYSLSYLYSWSKEKDFKEVDDSLNTIINYSKKIINNFEKFYDREFGFYSERNNLNCI